jgi:membrane associated rhomboid family serine protease
MFPLRDVHRASRAPVVTRLLVLAMALAFGWQVLVGMQGQEGALLAQFAVIPRCFLTPGACGIELPRQDERLWQPLISAMFLHGGLAHLAFNAWFLWVFGPGVEERLGRVKYLVFYLACGMAASCFHIVSQPLSNAPLIGASGAIAGVLGAHLVLLPRSWILSYIPPIWILPVPSVLFLILWIVGQAGNALVDLPLNFLGGSSSGGIAWMAHIGGFVCGAWWAWRIKPWFKRSRESPETTGDFKARRA